MSPLLLQVTDTHLLPTPGERLLGVCTQSTLEAVLGQALAEQVPDALIASGDIAHGGEDEAYRRFLATVRRRYGGPVLSVPGNHDVAEAFSGALPTAAVRAANWLILGIDTHVEGQVGGAVRPAELKRLQTALACSDADHALVVGHHCPAAIGAPWLDEHRIENADALLAALNASGKVRAYLGGHVHQEVAVTAGAVRVYATPSTCFQFAPRSQRFQLDDGAAPGCRWLTLGENGEIHTRVSRLAPP